MPPPEALGLLALVLPAIGYAAAYEFKVGQLAAMGLPDELLSLGLRDIVAGAISVLIAGAFMFGVISFFGFVVSGKDVPQVERSLVQVLAPTGVLLVLFIASGQLTPTGWVVFGVSALLMLAGELLPPLLTERDAKGLEAKLSAYRHRELDLRPSRLSRLITWRREYVVAVSLAYLVFAIASPVGSSVARARSAYAVMHTQPERIVVSEFGGSLVTLVFDRTARTARSPVLVMHAEDATSGLYLEHLGPVQFTSVR